MHRPHQRPFNLVNRYLHASDRASAVQLADSLFRLLHQSGEDCLFIGDWNNTPEQQPAVGPLQNGSLHAADDVAGSSCVTIPTRTDGRHIDYASILFGWFLKSVVSFLVLLIMISSCTSFLSIKLKLACLCLHLGYFKKSTTYPLILFLSIFLFRSFRNYFASTMSRVPGTCSVTVPSMC